MNANWQRWKDREAANEAAREIEVEELTVQEIVCTTVAEEEYLSNNPGQAPEMDNGQ